MFVFSKEHWYIPVWSFLRRTSKFPVSKCLQTLQFLSVHIWFNLADFFQICNPRFQKHAKGWQPSWHLCLLSLARFDPVCAWPLSLSPVFMAFARYLHELINLKHQTAGFCVVMFFFGRACNLYSIYAWAMPPNPIHPYSPQTATWPIVLNWLNRF